MLSSLFLLCTLIVSVLSNILSLELPDIRVPPEILPNVTYSAGHIQLNLQWILPVNFPSLSFEFKISTQNKFAKASIFELFENIYYVNIILSYDTNSDFQLEFRLLIDNYNGICQWTNIYILKIPSQIHIVNADDSWYFGIKNIEKYKTYSLYALGGTAALGTITIALPLAGFTAGGIAAGSLAASIQSTLGVVGSGTIFSAVQSAGVAGFTVATKAIIGTIGAGIVGLLYNDDNDDHEHEVFQWFLNKVDLAAHNKKYSKLFIENGYDTMKLIKEMNKEDLIEIGITKIGHRKHILKEIKKLNELFVN